MANITHMYYRHTLCTPISRDQYKLELSSLATVSKSAVAFSCDSSNHGHIKKTFYTQKVIMRRKSLIEIYTLCDVAYCITETGSTVMTWI